ncbi:hypothetical protein HMI54_003988 [Coelomomyces lativittatus]|nr:hypothetical protein HMI56_006671 [Coelomomyces lativittatus]KAJ1517804.1 hypothetical protein HMI54_003988 [Coelomomyces lativittatus]
MNLNTLKFLYFWFLLAVFFCYLQPFSCQSSKMPDNKVGNQEMTPSTSTTIDSVKPVPEKEHNPENTTTPGVVEHENKDSEGKDTNKTSKKGKGKAPPTDEIQDAVVSRNNIPAENTPLIPDTTEATNKIEENSDEKNENKKENMEGEVEQVLKNIDNSSKKANDKPSETTDTNTEVEGEEKKTKKNNLHLLESLEKTTDKSGSKENDSSSSSTMVIAISTLSASVFLVGGIVWGVRRYKLSPSSEFQARLEPHKNVFLPPTHGFQSVSSPSYPATLPSPYPFPAKQHSLSRSFQEGATQNFELSSPYVPYPSSTEDFIRNKSY